MWKRSVKEDIEKICNNVSFFEMTRIMALVAQLNASEHKHHGPMKADLKKIVNHLIERVEGSSSKLRTPVFIREMMFSL